MDRFNQKRLYRLGLLLLTGLFLFASPLAAMAAGDSPNHPLVDWDRLNLDSEQRSTINRLEADWRKTYNELSPQIKQDRQQLNRVLNMPKSDMNQVMTLQQQIQTNEHKLRQEATRTFLMKKQQLSPGQCKQLMNMVQQGQ